MRKNEVFPYYRRCCTELGKYYDYMQSLFIGDYIDELCKIRGYVGVEQRTLLSEMNIGYCYIDDIESLGGMAKELGLVTSQGNFLLGGRFLIPVYDISGELVSLIGYFNDKKKYITLPTPFFSKECMFFNFKQAYELSVKEYNGLVFLVEGIFDCLSLRSLGLPCIATMGSSVSKVKCELLKFFRKVIAIPDNDATGRRALNRYDKRYGWNVPYNATMVRFEGGSIEVGGMQIKVKDMDDFVSLYEANDVREMLLSFRDSKEEIEVLRL